MSSANRRWDGPCDPLIVNIGSESKSQCIPQLKASSAIANKDGAAKSLIEGDGVPKLKQQIIN